MNGNEQMASNEPITTADRQESRRQDFEQRVVYEILWRAGIHGQVRQLKAEKATQTGSPRLTLEWFRTRFPGFPIRLGAALLPDGTSPPWIDVFERFTTTPLFLAYQQWRDDQQVDDHVEQVGLVFNMGAVTFVLHNLVGTEKPRGMRVVRTLGCPPVTFVIEEFRVLLGSIGDSWAQETSEQQVIAESDSKK